MSRPKRVTSFSCRGTFKGFLRRKFRLHYFQFEIKEWVSNTAHLTHNEESAYLRLICFYYDSERPIAQDDLPMVFRKCRINNDLGMSMMNEFFRFDHDLNSWSHDRCNKEIDKYHAKHEQASRAGKASAERKANGRTTGVQPIINQESLTINQFVDNTTDVASKTKVSKRGSRIDPEWTLPKEWADWAKEQRPTLDVQSVADQFKDFWISKAGAGATKLDWQATWRNWVRNQKAPLANRADVILTTVPSRKERDPALVKIDEDKKNWTPPSPEIVAKMRAIASGANVNQPKGNL
jgi:uncharacterized protein YdaU (DUF1376 family)